MLSESIKVRVFKQWLNKCPHPYYRGHQQMVLTFNMPIVYGRVAQFRQALVSLMIGTNDCAREATTPAIFESNLSAFITRTRALDAIPVLHTPQSDYSGNISGA